MAKIPLFHIYLLVDYEKIPKYSSYSKEVVYSILTIFEQSIRSLQEINQVEQKLLPYLFKTHAKMYFMTTVKPELRPKNPNPNEKWETPDKHLWVYDEYLKLRDCVMKIIDPLDDYIDTYARFQKEYEFDPEKEIASYEDPEEWPKVDVFRSSIIFHKAEEKRLQGEIPEEIIYSVFKIITKVIRDMLAAKHAK